MVRMLDRAGVVCAGMALMLFRICGGIAFLLQGLGMIGMAGVPPIVVGILLILAAVGLLAGI